MGVWLKFCPVSALMERHLLLWDNALPDVIIPLMMGIICRFFTFSSHNYYSVSAAQKADRITTTLMASWCCAVTFALQRSLWLISTQRLSDFGLTSQPWLTSHHWSAPVSHRDWPEAMIDSVYWSTPVCHGTRGEQGVCVFKALC